MKIPNIGNVMNKFEILGVVGEGKFSISWVFFSNIQLYLPPKKVNNSGSINLICINLDMDLQARYKK